MKKSFLPNLAIGAAVLIAHSVSGQSVTNIVSVRSSQGMGVRITWGTGVLAQTYDKAYTRNNGTNDAGKAWIQFDLRDVWAAYGQANLVSATLTLWGENGTSRQFNVAGLSDNAGLEDWDMWSLWWTNAPANDVNSGWAFDWSKVFRSTNLWEARGTSGVDLARPDLGSNFDQCARYTSPDIAAFLATDTDGKVTFMISGSPNNNNQNWWIGTNGTYANDINLGYTSTNPATYGDVIRDSPTLTMVFIGPPMPSQPVFTNLLLMSQDIILQGSNGLPQAPYQVLRSEDVSQPINNWQPIGIMAFDERGGFCFTDRVTSAACGFYCLRVLSNSPVCAPAITVQPESQTVGEGQEVVFSVVATGTPPLYYQWYYNTNVPLAGKTNSTLTLTNVQLADAGAYHVTVSNFLGVTTSAFAMLTVTSPPAGQPPIITVQPASLTIGVGQTATFSVTATGTPPLYYQWYYNTNVPLAGKTNSTLTLTNVQLSNAGKYSVLVTNLFGSATSVLATLTVTQAVQELLAFPEAEGYGKYASGGRGGAVYEVTTLNPTGTGSLGAALSASGKRTVVFRVGGTITGNFTINNGDITIAGQTAPGDGICIRGRLSINANNVIIRYIRVRNDPAINPDSDAISCRGRSNIILDHVSASWGTDEVISVYQNTNVTIQWCIISEACGKDGGHQFGGIWGNQYGTYHHNLFAHNVSRTPRWASGSKYNDYRNNVIYNWDYQSCYGGENYADSTWNFFTVNMIANYYKYGPATDSGVRRRIAEPSARSAEDKGSWYVEANYVYGYPDVTANNWLGVDGENYIKLNEPWPAMPISQQSAEDAYFAVLAHVGCSKPVRDPVDARIVQEVANGTATYGDSGIITSPSQVGGWPTLASGTPPGDTDHDGMPDAWEVSHGLNPNDAADRNGDLDGDGYTNLEEYLNELGAF